MEVLFLEILKYPGIISKGALIYFFLLLSYTTSLARPEFVFINFTEKKIYIWFMFHAV